MQEVYNEPGKLGAKPFGKVSMSSAWGQVDDITDRKKMIRQSMKQMEWFLRYGKGNEPAHTRKEIEGYRELLLTDNDTIDKFKEVRSSMRSNGEAIAYLKKRGWWSLS
jgi:hypothetical protein